MSNFKLNLPTDIPWERICVTEDMIDPIVCDERLPAKWQTSMALFKYKPDDEFQMFPEYNLTYLKVTATITGYQPLDQEIQGEIDWDGVDISTISGLTDLLNSYNPCHGAILQVVVGPKDKKPEIPLKDYPFFMDFEPKKRELYELATDTHEKQSRSIESLNITKSSGSTQSMEVLDVDMGGGGFGTQSSYAGTGGGFNYSAPNGQWGTKRLNTDESLSARSSDVGQEKRESFSYSTQLSQMYHLLDSYHLGTNRGVFFIQPRPHTLEEPSGFVRGPRPVDGIQEFFMVVAQPKEQDDFCVSLRLDTSHLTKTPIMDYERKTAYTDTALANANLPTKQDTFIERRVRWTVDYFIGSDDINYKHYAKKVTDDVVYPVPEGFRIESHAAIVDNKDNGVSTISISPDGRTLTIHAEANSSIWFRDEGAGACIDNCPPDTLDEITGRVETRVQINLISTEPTKEIAEEEALMITTRGLCCCKSEEKKPMDEYVVGINSIPAHLTPNIASAARLKANTSVPVTRKNLEQNDEDPAHVDENCKGCSDNEKLATEKYTIQQANELSNYIKTETIKSLNDPTVKLQKYVDTDFFAKGLKSKLIQFEEGRKILNEPVIKEIPNKIIPKLEKYFEKGCEEITRMDLLSLRTKKLSTILEIQEEDAHRIKLVSMGVLFKPDQGDKCEDESSDQIKK